jgi:hypothetical protein
MVSINEAPALTHIDYEYEEDQVLHLLRPRVAPGVLLIEIMSKSGASFIENTSETRCFID